jgi:hypothetical protein
MVSKNNTHWYSKVLCREGRLLAATSGLGSRPLLVVQILIKSLFRIADVFATKLDEFWAFTPAAPLSEYADWNLKEFRELIGG